MTTPIPMRWNGEAMVPVNPHWARRADEAYVVGEVYSLIEQEERSWASHAHQFAWLKEAWQQLPENLADQFPSPESLRKRALIEAGFYDEQVIDCGANAAALRVAQGLRARPGEAFSLVIVRAHIVVIRTARSQSRRAMDRQEFQVSKDAIMGIVAGLIGVEPETLQRNAGRAA